MKYFCKLAESACTDSMRNWFFIIATLLLSCSSTGRQNTLQCTVSTELFHTHKTDLTYRKVKSGIRIFLLTASEGHTHSYELREDQVAYLELNVPIALDSTLTNGHKHSVLIQKSD